MKRNTCVWLFVGFMSWAVSATLEGATVSITPTATSVAQGGSDSFTVTVTPNTYVQKVILTYQGDSGQDELTSSPYTFTHQFNNPMDNLSVTTTVQYNNGDPDDHTSTTINVVGLTISGSATPTRGVTIGYTVQSNPTGKTVSGISWTYTWSGGSNTSSSTNWSGTMVVDGTLQCNATVSGVNPTKTKTITITARNWTVPISCAQDNESGWGDIPDVNNAEFGLNRDRDSNVQGYVFVPRNSPTDFTPARTLAQVSSGPCAGWWYISSCTLKCQRETVINRYIKSDGPTLGGINWVGSNSNQSCFDTSPGDFLQAEKNHEYRGTPDTYESNDGHQGRIEYSIRIDQYDAKQHVESLTDRVKSSLEGNINSVIAGDESQVWNYAGSEDFEFYGPNWGGPGGLGYGLNSLWDSGSSGWTGCVNGPASF